jgi:hypothetical protein
LIFMVFLVAAPSGAAAQDQAWRLQDRAGRTTRYAERLAGSQSQYRIVGRDGLARGYADGATGRITGRDGRVQGYVTRR